MNFPQVLDSIVISEPTSGMPEMLVAIMAAAVAISRILQVELVGAGSGNGQEVVRPVDWSI